MARWIAFDDRSAEVLASRLPRETTLEHRREAADALELALEAAPAGLALLPGRRPGESLLVRIRHRPPQNHVAPHHPGQPLRYEASGFLGLHDEPIYEEEKPRSWWHRLWE